MPSNVKNNVRRRGRTPLPMKKPISIPKIMQNDKSSPTTPIKTQYTRA